MKVAPVSLTKPRLLVVPHIYAEDIVVREIELARRLTRHFDVFLLKWRDAQHVHAASVISRRLKQIAVAGGSAFPRRTNVVAADGLRLVEASVWQPLLFQRLIGQQRARACCTLYNHRRLRKLEREFGITHVLLANELFGVTRTEGVRTFFDIVDWFPEENESAARLDQVRANIRGIGQRANGVFSVSEALAEKLKRECGIQAIPLPNGADISRLRSVRPEKIGALREKLGVTNKFVIGYIGNHGSYTGVDLVVNAFLAARPRLPDAVLLIVGPADYWRHLLLAHRNAAVIATGSIPPAEMPDYFNAIDLGVLAQGKTTGTDFAFQIKMVEYSACRKCVVCTPLVNWQSLAWPNVLLAEATTNAWADAFERARSIRWRPEWDGNLEQYDWRALAEKAARVMLAGVPCAS